MEKLERPIIPYSQYIEGGNKNWDKLLSEIKVPQMAFEKKDYS